MLNAKSSVEKHVHALNESMVNFLKRKPKPQQLFPYIGSNNANGCQICNPTYPLAIKCPNYANFQPKCQKCGRLHKMENCGLNCTFYNGMEYIEDKCWKNNPKVGISINNFL
jgi:hypothetical protein